MATVKTPWAATTEVVSVAEVGIKHPNAAQPRGRPRSSWAVEMNMA